MVTISVLSPAINSISIFAPVGFSGEDGISVLSWTEWSTPWEDAEVAWDTDIPGGGPGFTITISSAVRA